MSAFPIDFCPMCGGSTSARRFDGRERAYCETCDEYIFRIPFPTAGVAVVEGSRVCLIKRATNPHRGTWAIPGGIMEYDETPSEAAVRELHEETGIKAVPDECQPLSTRGTVFDNMGSIGITYAISRKNTSSKIEAGSEASDVQFWSLDKIEQTSEELRAGETPLIEKAIRQVNNTGE